MSGDSDSRRICLRWKAILLSRFRQEAEDNRAIRIVDKKTVEQEIKPKSPDYVDTKGLVPGHTGQYSGIYKMPIDAYSKAP